MHGPGNETQAPKKGTVLLSPNSHFSKFHNFPEEMSRRFGKRKEEDEYASEGDNPPKKSSRTDDSDDADGIVVCEISKNRRVSVRSFQGKIMVDIREFYVKDGKQMPGRKGISLSMDQWNVLRDHADEIDELVANS